MSPSTTRPWPPAGRLREAGAADQAAACWLDLPRPCRPRQPGRGCLLDGLRKAGAHEQAAALAGRAAAHAPLDNPGGVADLLDGLRKAGAHEQAAALAGRAAAHAPLDNPGGVADLLDSLRKAGAHDQAAALLARDPAAHARLDNPGTVASLLTACGRRARTTRPPRCWPVIQPPTPASTTRTPWADCWTACGRQARTTRPPRWRVGCRRAACSSSSSSRTVPQISSVSDGRPTAPRPRRGAGKTWIYGLFPRPGDRRYRRRLSKRRPQRYISGRPKKR